MNREADFFGVPIKIPMGRPTRTQERDPGRIFTIDTEELKGLANAVAILTDAYDLDDYAAFRLAVFAVDQQVRPSRERALRTLGRAIHEGSWGLGSRMLAVGAILRLLGWAVVPHARRDGVILLYIPFAGDLTRYNANIRTTEWTRTVNGRPVSKHRYQWLIWDGKGPLGLASYEDTGEALLDADAIIDGPQRAFDFTQRDFPKFTLRQSERRALDLHGRDQKLPYHIHADAARFAMHAPPMQFEQQIRFACRELDLMAITPTLQKIAKQTRDEVELVNLLLRTLQHNFVYTEGPLRPLFQIFDDRRGDCDQLSLVMAAMLARIGYTGNDLVAMEWEDHLCLALKPRSGKKLEGAEMFVESRAKERFYPLEPTYYYTYNGHIATRWGQINPQNADRPFKILRLHLR